MIYSGYAIKEKEKCLNTKFGYYILIKPKAWIKLICEYEIFLGVCIIGFSLESIVFNGYFMSTSIYIICIIIATIKLIRKLQFIKI